MSESYPLPVIDYRFGRPSDKDTETWVTHYERLLRSGKWTADELRADLEWPENPIAKKHPLVRKFHLDALEAARQRVAKPPPATGEPKWHKWQEWTRADFERAVAWDQEHGGRGGKITIGRRCLVHPSPLYRRWQAVAPGESWPSGNKGPLSRRI